MADSVVIVDGGRLVATGHPGELSRALPRGDPLRRSAGLDVAGLGATLGALVTEERLGSTWSAAGPSRPWSRN